jgi:hypothetical protein
MSLEERLEEARKKELEKAMEKRKKEEAVFLKKQEIQREKLDKSFNLEKTVKENFLPILDIVKETYIKEGNISFNNGDGFSIIKMTWDYVDNSSGDQSYLSRKEFSVETRQDLSFKLLTSMGICAFESNLNDVNWKDKLEDAIFSLLTSPIPKYGFFFPHEDTGP